MSSCEKIKLIPSSQDELPPITTEGKGTFSCLINGKVWNSCGGGSIFGGSSQYGEYHDFSKIFRMRDLRECDGHDDTIYISAYVTDSLGTYEFIRATYNDKNQDCNDPLDAYELLESADNWVEILHLDTHEAIVAGIFQCTLVHPDCGDTLYITEGRFDHDWAN
jgi:hypothetical protein